MNNMEHAKLEFREADRDYWLDCKSKGNLDLAIEDFRQLINDCLINHDQGFYSSMIIHSGIVRATLEVLDDNDVLYCYNQIIKGLYRVELLPTKKD